MMGSTEESRFTEAFYAVLRRDPNKAPGPTAINRELRKHERGTYRSPLNILNGRMSKLRGALLEKEGFVKEYEDHKFGRWHRP